MQCAQERTAFEEVLKHFVKLSVRKRFELRPLLPKRLHNNTAALTLLNVYQFHRTRWFQAYYSNEKNKKYLRIANCCPTLARFSPKASRWTCDKVHACIWCRLRATVKLLKDPVLPATCYQAVKVVQVPVASGILAAVEGIKKDRAKLLRGIYGKKVVFTSISVRRHRGLNCYRIYSAIVTEEPFEDGREGRYEKIVTDMARFSVSSLAAPPKYLVNLANFPFHWIRVSTSTPRRNK